MDGKPTFDGKASLQRMRDRTREAREHEAQRLFSPENLNASFSAAAAQGQSAVMLAPSVPMDLSDSETSRATQRMLEAAGFLAEWKTSRPTPEGEPYTTLRVSWGADAKIKD